MSSVESPKNAKGDAKGQEAKRAIIEMAPLVLEVVRNHPEGITAEEITEKLGFVAYRGQDSLHNLSKYWTVLSAIDMLAIKNSNQKKEPPLKKKYFSEEALYSLK